MIIIIIVNIINIVLIFYSLRFFIPDGGFTVETEWHQDSSVFPDFSQYSGW